MWIGLYVRSNCCALVNTCSELFRCFVCLRSEVTNGLMESCWNLLTAASDTKGTSQSLLITEPYICTLICLCSLISYEHSRGALGAGHTWRIFKQKKITLFWKRTEYTKQLFCSAVSSGRRQELLCAAMDTTDVKSPPETSAVKGSQHLPNFRKYNPDNTAKYSWEFIIANIAN